MITYHKAWTCLCCEATGDVEASPLLSFTAAARPCGSKRTVKRSEVPVLLFC